MSLVPDFRIQTCNKAPANAAGDYVLYWMIANRRTHWNFSLQRAVEWSMELKKPLVILESLRCDYQWASDRLHRFISEGMKDNALRCKNANVFYYPYLEPTPAAGKGFLNELGKKACVVVTDDYPAFFLPRMILSAARRLGVRMEKVDSNGLLPIRWTDRIFLTALSFRRFLQNNLELHLHSFPQTDSLAGYHLSVKATISGHILERWLPSHEAIDDVDRGSLNSFPIDHSVTASPIQGGERAANRMLVKFIKTGLNKYSESKNHPDDDATSSLSPYIHFGQISVHQIFHALIEHEEWTKERIWEIGRGQREGWWGMSLNAESFLDQLITWRELGFNACTHLPNYDCYDSLSGWAKTSLDKHKKDPRPYLYDLRDFENAETHDSLWNAAQRQLRTEGQLHNYLRMLWGKKILEWTRCPEEALDTMIHLNNKYALDGRDPNSYTGIFWILGRYDRPWRPERPIFGRIRYMSSENTRRKLRVKEYLRKYSE